MWSVIAVLITAGLGSWLTYRWQQRSAQASRFFDAAKVQHDQMTFAANDIASIIGKRIYSSQRICLITEADPLYDDAKSNFQAAVLAWNERYLQFELNTRTLFKDSYVVVLEDLQRQLAELTNRVAFRAKDRKNATRPDYYLLREISSLRSAYFQFLQGMSQEADQLFRQTHFGVRVRYNRGEIDHFSTWNLTKALFTGPEEESSVVRSPTDFGLPVSVDQARLGIN